MRQPSVEQRGMVKKQNYTSEMARQSTGAGTKSDKLGRAAQEDRSQNLTGGKAGGLISGTSFGETK